MAEKHHDPGRLTAVKRFCPFMSWLIILLLLRKPGLLLFALLFPNKGVLLEVLLFAPNKDDVVFELLTPNVKLLAVELLLFAPNKGGLLLLLFAPNKLLLFVEVVALLLFPKIFNG